MKKNQILTMLSVLVLALPLGGCNTNEENDIGEGDVESNSSESLLVDEPVSTPGELISKIDDYCNYSLTFEYNSYLGTESITYYQYLTGDFDYDEVWDSLEQSYTYAFEISYTEDAIEADEYVITHYNFGDISTYLGSYYYINEENNVCWYYIYDAVYETVSYGHGNGEWSNYCYSLNTSYNYGVQNRFSYSESGTTDNGEDYDAYTLNSNYAQYLFLGLGADFMFADPDSEAKNITHEYTNFFEESQQMSSYFHKRHYLWNDAGTLLYPEEFHLYTTVHDVWNTDNSAAWTFHEQIQSQLFEIL